MQDTTIVLKNAPMLVRFEPSLKHQLEAGAKREGYSSAAALIRAAVRHFLDPDAKCKPAKVRK